MCTNLSSTTCPISTHDGASVNFSANSHETDNSVVPRFFELLLCFYCTNSELFRLLMCVSLSAIHFLSFPGVYLYVDRFSYIYIPKSFVDLICRSCTNLLYHLLVLNHASIAKIFIYRIKAPPPPPQVDANPYWTNEPWYLIASKLIESEQHINRDAFVSMIRLLSAFSLLTLFEVDIFCWDCELRGDFLKVRYNLEEIRCKVISETLWWDLAKRLECLTAYAEVESVLGSIPASSDTAVDWGAAD